MPVVLNALVVHNSVHNLATLNDIHDEFAEHIALHFQQLSPSLKKKMQLKICSTIHIATYNKDDDMFFNFTSSIVA